MMEFEIDIQKYVYAYVYTARNPTLFLFQQVAQQFHLKLH